MSRSLSSEFITALTSDSVDLFYAVELLFDDTDGTRYDQGGYAANRAVRLWTGYGDRTIDGETYTGAGSLLTVGLPAEASDLSARGANLTLAGEVTDLLTLALGEPYVGRKGRVLFGAIEFSEAGAFHSTEVFAGVMDKMTPTDNGDTATIELALEGLNITLQKANVRRYTSAGHKAIYPSDTFFDSVTSLQDKDIPWGRTVDTAAG